MRGIYKRGNIYWIRYAGLDGRTVYESTGSSRYKDAETVLFDRKKAIKEGKQPEPIKKIQNYTFNQLAEQYLVWAERQRSIRSKKGFIRQLVETFGNLPLRRFSTMMIEQFQTERINKGNKPATINRLLATLKHMFTKAEQWEMVEEHATRKMKQVKLLEENNRRLRYLSVEECHTLLNTCDSHLKPIVFVALNTGMRKGEILSLQWNNIDLKNGFILLEITKNGERREIPINATLNRTLQGLDRRLDVPSLFFDKNTGKAYKDIKKSFNTACKKAGIKDFHFHDLRHTFASHLVMAGVDITAIKELLGHKTLTMTLRYWHLAPSHKVKAVETPDKTIQEKTNYTILKISDGLRYL
ncbi:phage integrase family protein [Candidatus Magnetobacterium bavaricum]|uniref:Phage integrase family protein n=1 Tax=Candidatus Magnetobacterium bavaricum TaxID=29290 RepID=A0A0F3GXW4_9BACT|nr:phage integrase family protein [Candidatus Magnetobacterium bavaricum]